KISTLLRDTDSTPAPTSATIATRTVTGRRSANVRGFMSLPANAEQVLLAADEQVAVRHRQRRDDLFADVVDGEQLEHRTRPRDAHDAVLARDVNLAVADHGRGVILVAHAVAPHLLAADRVQTGAEALAVHDVQPALVRHRRRDVRDDLLVPPRHVGL